MDGAINTTAAAFVFGLITSLHCVLMCGPLICALVPFNVQGKQLHIGALIYQIMRVCSYTAIGALLGGFGKQIATFVESDTAHVFPWLLVALLFFIGFGLEKWFPQPRFFGKWVGAIQRRFMPRNPYVRYAFTGLLTPLLPCGPLYMIFGVCLLAGDVAKGAGFMAAFGLGTVPLLMVLHLQYTMISRKWLTLKMPLIRRGVALLTASLLMMRLCADVKIEPTTGADAAGSEVKKKCPMCP